MFAFQKGTDRNVHLLDYLFLHNSLNFSLHVVLSVARYLRVSVRFFTILREVTRKKEEALELPEGENVTIAAVLEKLSDRYGRKFSEYVYEKKTREVKGFLQFLVNGRSMASFKGLETVLVDGDVLAIIPPVGGG
jgi:molybdopterin synthase sulfur carrier subunit